VNVELITTGSELLLGRTQNTHASWIGRRLADLGLPVTRQVTVPDSGTAIRDAVAEALLRAPLIITTGGLGPTSDDRTRELLADLLNCPLQEDPDLVRTIDAFFRDRQRTPPARVFVQAQVPAGAQVLPNLHGTAPGLAITCPPGPLSPTGALIILLPGPPRELHPLFDSSVVPLLRQQFHPDFFSVTLRTCGLGESWIEEQLTPLLPPWLQRGLEIGYCARSSEVDIRLATCGPDTSSLLAEAVAAVRHRLGPWIFGDGDQRLEDIVMELARTRHARLAIVESCTGGLLSHRITNVPGASEVLWGSWIAYANEAKERTLGIPSELLQTHGAVSEPCARALAESALRLAQATHALSITGIAGPGGGTPDKPVGTVFIGLADAQRPTEIHHRYLPYDRETFKFVATQQALDLLRRRLQPSFPSL
jgi:nicotinamide-nucleotide amidase